MLENWLRAQVAPDKPVKLTDLLDFYAPRNGKFEVNNRQAAVISLGHFGGQFDYPNADYPARERIAADDWNCTLGLLKFLAEDESVPDNVRAELAAWGLHRGEFAHNRHLPNQL